MENEQETAPQPRRRRGGNRLIDQPFTAKLIASQLMIRASELRTNGQDDSGHEYRRPEEAAADNDMADLLTTAADELKGVGT